MAKMKYGSHPGYEPTDAHFGPIVKFTVWLSIGTAITLVGSIGLLHALKEVPGVESNEPHPLSVKDSQFAPGPHLESFRGLAWDDHGRLIVKAGPDGKVDTMQVSSAKSQAGATLETASPFQTYMWRDFGRDARSHLGEPIDAFKGADERVKDWQAHNEQKPVSQKDGDGYGWVDRAAGVANVPVERAQELVMKKGLPQAERPKE